MVLAYKRFYHAYVCDGFLNIGVERVKLCLHYAELGERIFNQEKKHDYHERHYYRKNQCEPRVHDNRHDYCTYHHAGRTQAHTQQHIDHVLHLRNVVCETRDERAGLKFIDICE